MPRAPYFAEHLSFLKYAGAALARLHPRVAGMLAGDSYDPDVEQLLRGIAYIAGKITERQTGGLDEYCQLLFDVLFPNYLCPLPAASIVQFELPPGSPVNVVPRDTCVMSTPVLGTPCIFYTTQDVDVGGIRLRDLRWEPGAATTQLTLEFDAEPWLSQPPEHDRIRFYLHGEPLLTRSLYEWLFCRLARVDLVDVRGRAMSIPPSCVAPVGFSEDEALFTPPPGSFAGFRLLQEYFAFSNKFMFVDFNDIYAHLQAHGLSRTDRFGIRLTFRVDASSLVVTRDNLRLGCTPVVNLFEHPADPVRRDAAKMDYRVRPSGPHLHYEIIRITEVTALARGGPVVYPLLSEIDLQGSAGRYAQLIRRGVRGEIETYVSMHDSPGELPSEQTFMVDMLCSNGQLPEGLAVGDISSPQVEGVSQLAAHNLIPPSTSLYPPLREPLRQRLIRHIAMCQRPLSDMRSLRDAIDLYDLRSLYDPKTAGMHQRMLESLFSCETQMVQQMHRGMPLMGRATQLVVDETGFSVPAEAFLFGSILNEFVALQTPINVFSQFSVKRAQTQDLHTWPKRLGEQQLESC